MGQENLDLCRDFEVLRAERDIGKKFHDLAVSERDYERLVNDRLKKENEALRAELEKKIQANDYCNELLAKWEKRMKSFQEDNNKLEKENEALRAELEDEKLSYKAVHEGLMERIATLESMLSISQTEVQRLTRRLEEVEDEFLRFRRGW